MKLNRQRFLRLLAIFPPGAARAIRLNMIASSALVILDIAALGVLALSLTPMMTGQSIKLPLLGTVPPSGYGWILLGVCLLIIGKSSLATALQWFITRRLGTFEIELGDRLFASYLHAPWVDRLARTTQQVVHLADVGVTNAISGYLIPYIGFPAVVTTIVAVTAMVAIAQPITAILTVIYLGLIGFLLTTVLSRRVRKAAATRRDYGYKVSGLIADMLSALKEITLRNGLDSVASAVHRDRTILARVRANMNFMSTFPRFILDASLIGGIVVIGGVSYLIGGIVVAGSAIALFAIAGVRLVPSLTAMQSAITALHSNGAYVDDLVSEVELSQSFVKNAEVMGRDALPASPQLIRFDKTSFTFPNRNKPAVANVTLDIRLGSTVGIVGTSGAGKSTLVDLILGLLVPTKGDVTIDGVPLRNVLREWRSHVGYVPQDVTLFNGTVAQNVALTWNDDIDEAKVTAALKRAQLWPAIKRRPGGLYSEVGDRGLALSGGQRQRLGIARALYNNPLILVMDEATSALDTRTEADVADALNSLAGEVTIISVAHRLSTIRDCDQIVYMQDGAVRDHGTFDQIVKRVPEFREQARLAGLV